METAVRLIPEITVRDLTVRYSRTCVLRDVTFKMPRGETVAVIGPSGAGKSTLLHCLAGILPPSAGVLTLDSRPYAAFSRRELARFIACVPQMPEGFSVPTTVYQLVLMGRFAFRKPWRAYQPSDYESVQRSLRWTGLEPLADRHLNTLSGGESRRAYLASALAQEPAILLLDEPTTFLDPRQQEEVLQLLDRVKREFRITLVVVTHDINAAMILADRVLGLKSGRLVFDGTAAEAMRQETLSMIFEKTFHFAAHPIHGRPVVLPGTLEYEPVTV